MRITNAQLEQSVSTSILELITEFQHSPYTFLYESDLQAALFAKLRTSLPERIVVPGSGKPLQSYELAISYTEYLNRVDIACIDVEGVASLQRRSHKGSDIYIYNVPILLGIELKYRKMGDRFGLSACLDDLEKLRRLRIRRPIVLGFVQNEAEIPAFLSGYTAYRVPEGLVVDQLLGPCVIGPHSFWTVDVGVA